MDIGDQDAEDGKIKGKYSGKNITICSKCRPNLQIIHPNIVEARRSKVSAKLLDKSGREVPKSEYDLV
jgi:hypothetical protein